MSESFSKLQLEYLEKATHRWNFKTGATRSGKTYLDYYVIPQRLRARKGLSGLNVILGVTKSTIQRNIIEPMQELWGPELVGDIKSDNTCYMFGEKVYCLSAEKVNQVSKLRGSSIKYCYGDEVADWSEDVFELLKSRLDKSYSCFDGSLNPQGPNHWLKKFLDNENGANDIYVQKYQIFDNPFLDPFVVQSMCSEYQGTVFYKRYILGEWALAEGLVYPMLDYEENVIRTPWKFDQRHKYYVSVDYGTVNPFAVGVYEYCPETREIHLIRDFGWDGRAQGRKDNEFYYQLLDKSISDLPITCILVDPSAAGFIETIQKYKKYRVKGAKNDVLTGIQTVTKYINLKKLKIYDTCKHTLKEFQEYAWDDKSQNEQVIKENDHFMDELRYMVMEIAGTKDKWRV